MVACSVLFGVGAVLAVLPRLGELSANVQTYGHHAIETPLPLTDSRGTIVYSGFPADTLAAFRLYSVVAQALLWTTIGLVFAPLAERLLAPTPEASPLQAAPGSTALMA
jgi:Probable cobalt transporter subunit (CbtA)